MNGSGFRRVLAAEVVSNFGSMLTRLVIPWIATLTLGVTPLEMGLLLVADVAAGALGALLLGTLVDRLPKRRVMVLADLARAALLAVVALLAWRGAATLPLLALAAAASGWLTMAFELARSAWVGLSLPVDQLATRNAQLSAVGSVTEAASFGIGGWVYQALGGALSLAADAASYIVSALCLWRVPEPPHAAAATQGRAADLPAEARDGLATLWREPTLRALALLDALIALAASLAATSYMIYVARDLAFAPGVLGMIFAVGGVGAAFGAGAAPALGRRFGSRGAIFWGLLLLALGNLCIPLAAGASALAVLLLLAHQLFGDGGYVLAEVHDRTLRQSVAPRELLGRVDAGIRMLGQGATLAGALFGGTFAGSVGARAALFTAAGLYALAALAAALLLGVRRR